MKALALITALLAVPALAQEGVFEAQVSVSGSSALTSADLSTGWKTVYCDTAAFYRMGTSAAVATTSDEPIPANTHWLVLITNDARRLAFITSGGTGTCSIYPRNVLGLRLLPPIPALLPNVNGIAITPSSVTTNALTVHGIAAAQQLYILDTNNSAQGFFQPVFGGGLNFQITAGDFTLTGASAHAVSIDGDTVNIGAAQAGITTVGNAGNSLHLDGNVSVGGGTAFSIVVSGTKAVTGASINAGTCANQGTTISLSGVAAGDACFLGLSASPGNGLAYSCVTGSSTCQIVACNASAGSLTSLTGTHRCTVIH